MSVAAWPYLRSEALEELWKAGNVTKAVEMSVANGLKYAKNTCSSEGVTLLYFAAASVCFCVHDSSVMTSNPQYNHYNATHPVQPWLRPRVGSLDSSRHLYQYGWSISSPVNPNTLRSHTRLVSPGNMHEACRAGRVTS